MTAPVLGIDLGTTNSAVAVANGQRVAVLADAEGHELIPSAVSFCEDGELIVGRRARERRLLDARNTVYSVKRLIGRPFQSTEVEQARTRFPFRLAQGPTGGVVVEAHGESYTLSEISAYILHEVRAQAERALGEKCTRAVVTVPASFNELQRSATKAAGRVAGLDILRILNEPTAAALAYGYGRAGGERIAVYDLGGGTFDLTILDLAGDVFEVVATAGDTYLGGDDIDFAIADQMAEAFASHHRFDPRSNLQTFERLRAAAEWAKCRLSSEQAVELRVEELAYDSEGTSLDLTFSLARNALETLAEPFVARSIAVCEDAMRIAGIRPTQVDQVILVGGSTRMPLVGRRVAEFFGREPLAHIDPELVVAQGAAIQGFALGEAHDAGRPIARVQLRRVTQGPASAPALGSPETTSLEAPLDAEKTFPDARAEARAGATTLRGMGGPAAPPLPQGHSSVLVPHESIAPSSTRAEDWISAPAPFEELPPAVRPPLLLDVTPLSLNVETVGGFCETVIKRNATIPVEQTRIFTTANDDQEVVRVQICQGESRRLVENQPLGAIELAGLRKAARGEIQIGVTFLLDADGTLGVRAEDLQTGRRQTIRINLLGELRHDQVESMRARKEELVARGRL